MFFILSKLLLFLIKPINWVFGLLLFSLFSNRKPRKRKSLIAAILLFYFFSNHFIFNQIVKLWEVKTITADQIAQPYPVGILLGGYSSSYITPNHDRQNFSQRANRFLNAYELYRTGKIEKLLLSGGTGSVFQDRPKEAESMNLFLQRIGIPEEDIIIESASRNTYENALYSKKVLQEQNIRGNYLLITSAWHMRRAVGCFDKVGLSYTPYSVDFLSEEDHLTLDNILLPSSKGLLEWEMLIKEWVGMVAYWMRGYI